MSVRLLLCFFACSINDPALICKFCAFRAANRSPDLQQQHPGYVARSCPKNTHGLTGVELVQPVKILDREILSRVDAAAGQDGERDAVLHQLAQARFKVKVVQLLQKTVRPRSAQLVEVVREIVLRRAAAGGDDLRRQVSRNGCAAIRICQRLRHGGFVRLLHAPEVRGA